MSSSTCLSGRSYRIDLEIVKCASTTSTNATSSPRTSQTSSPSSTLSESSSIAISTRKPRTPRKRPNQTYNEAAALLSTAYPNIFSSKSLSKPTKFSKPRETSSSSSSSLVDESSELLLPFRVFDSSGFVLQQPACSFFPEPKMTNSMMMMSPSSTTSTSNNTNNASWEVDSHDNSKEICVDAYYREEEEDFHTESILNEEIGEGIDSIMGSLNLSHVLHGPCSSNSNNNNNNNGWCGNWINCNNNIEGGRFQQQQLGDRALRRGRNWFHFPVVDMLQISPRLKSNSGEVMVNINNINKKKNKKKKKKKKAIAELKKDDDEEWVKVVENSINPNVAAAANNTGGGLLLKLDYQEVLNAWSDRPPPFPHHISSCANGIHLSGRLAQMDLLTESGGMREASVLRYKEKRRTRLFSKKIRYQVRKVNADRRPRMKGRFVRRGNSSGSHSRREE